MKRSDIVGIVSKLEPKYRRERRAVGLVNNINIELTLKKYLGASSFPWCIIASTETDTERSRFSIRFLANRYFKKLVKAYNLNEVTK